MRHSTSFLVPAFLFYPKWVCPKWARPKRAVSLLACSILAFSVLANSAYAGGGGGGKKTKKKSNRIKAEWTIENEVLPPPIGAPSEAQAGKSVDIPVVVMPITVNGRLVNYAFVSIRIVLNASVDTWKMRESAHFMRDALVRASHEQSFGKDGERDQLDIERTVTLARNILAPWVNDNQLDYIEVLNVDMLHG